MNTPKTIQEAQNNAQEITVGDKFRLAREALNLLKPFHYALQFCKILKIIDLSISQHLQLLFVAMCVVMQNFSRLQTANG